MFREGWVLFRKTWWSAAKLVLWGILFYFITSLLGSVPLMMSIARGGIDVRTFNPADANMIPAFVMFSIFLAAWIPTVLWALTSTASAPYYADTPATWEHIKRGFRRWIKTTGLWVGILVIQVPFCIWMLVDSGSGSALGRPGWWISAFVLSLTSVYATFLSLNMVRLGVGIRKSWAGLRLVPRREWAGTVGLLALAGVLASVLSVLAAKVIPLGGLLLPVFSYYALTCAVAVWHRYSIGSGTLLSSSSDGSDGPVAQC